MNILREKFIVKYDEASQCFLTTHPDTRTFETPLISIKKETFESMQFKKASQFIGERLILLIPQLREIYNSKYRDLQEIADANSGQWRRDQIVKLGDRSIKARYFSILWKKRGRSKPRPPMQSHRANAEIFQTEIFKKYFINPAKCALKLLTSHLSYLGQFLSYW